MKKNRIAALFLAALCGASMVGCGGGGNGGGNGDGNENKNNVEDPNKTTITVANYDGGIGSVWLDEAAERFATIHKDDHYEQGKTGIYVDVQRASGITMENILNETVNVYISEKKDISSLAQNGEFLDITDIVKDETRVGGSLESAIKSNKLDSLKGNDGKYYGLPHYEFFGGLSYDKEVFDKNRAYFAAASEAGAMNYNCKYGQAKFVTSLDMAKSNGPDGTAGTYDDGLPSTMQELIILMQYFKDRVSGYKPVALSGLYNNYSNYFFEGLWASLAGYQQMLNYYNCEGEIDVVTGYTNEPIFPGISYIKKPVVSKVTLNGSNGYLGNDMAAKYYAIAMLEIMHKEGFFTNGSGTSSVDHYGAQKTILYNPISSQYEKCAMLLEASYWYNEATIAGSIDSYNLLAGTTAPRDVRFMALPSAWDSSDVQAPSKNTIMDIGFGALAVNGNIANKPAILKAVKEFVSFLYSEEELKNFTLNTGMTRPIDCTVGNDEIVSLPLFSQNMYKMTAESNIVYYAGTTSAFKQAKGYLKLTLALPKAIKIGTEYNNYLTPIKAGSATQALFDATKYSAAEWANIYKA